MPEHSSYPGTLSRRIRRIFTTAGLVLVIAILLNVEEKRHEHELDYPSGFPDTEDDMILPAVTLGIPAELTINSTPSESLQFFLSKLGDPHYTDTYGDGYTWYIAAEELGMIGLPAIPYLIEMLDTADEYERTQVLYALRLAAQHRNMDPVTGREYVDISPDAFPPPEIHSELAVAWREWYGHYQTQLLAAIAGEDR